MSDQWNGEGGRLTDSERGGAPKPESDQVRGRATEGEEFDDAEDLDDDDLDDDDEEEDDDASGTI